MPEGVDAEKRETLRRFAAVGAAAPLARIVDSGSGESDARDAIAGYVAATPGVHFSKLRDDLKLGTGETQHHVRRLVESEVIESRRDGDYRRFFAAGQFSAFEQVALGYLRRSTPRGMVRHLLEDPAVTGGGLAERLEVSASTVSKYAAELEAAGLLSRTDGYRLTRPATLLLLLVRFADSFDAATVDFATRAADLIDVA